MPLNGPIIILFEDLKSTANGTPPTKSRLVEQQDIRLRRCMRSEQIGTHCTRVVGFILAIPMKRNFMACVWAAFMVLLACSRL
jgi:hypothetical protein